MLSPWVPETRLVPAAALGKLQEELGELVAIVARCQIQGIAGSEPETGELNHVKLSKEIADVQATMSAVSEVFGLNESMIDRRRMSKIDHLARWFALLARMP